MERLIDACRQGRVFLDLEAGSILDAAEQLTRALEIQGAIAASTTPLVLDKLAAREAKLPTAIGQSVAVPHTYLEGIDEHLIAVARLRSPINVGAPDGSPVRWVFLFLGPSGAPEDHLDALANLARLMSSEEFRYQALEARNVGEFERLIEARMAPAAEAPAEPADDGLRFSGRPFGGILADLRRRLPHYMADFRDGIDAKAAGSSLFLFFACLAPAIIFGGLMHGMTGGAIGAVEMIVATAACGVVYALVAGQPLIILGGTGPMLIFTGILYEYCVRSDVDFLQAYAWVGIWTGAILLVLAIADASAWMRYFTRFTDEIFAALISIIFIYEAIYNLIRIFQRASAGEAVGYDVALFSLLLALGTYSLAARLSDFRKSPFLFPAAREFLADFGPTIAIVGMAWISYAASDVIPLDPLPAPDSFQTTSGRPWLTPFLDAPASVIWLSSIPALLCAVLVYLDQNITARLVNSPDNKLQKGASYHLDLAVVAVLIAACSLYGLPWLVAATVRSLNHLRSLATTEQVVDGGGNVRTRILHVRENRVTGVVIHLMVAGSLLVLPMLQFIPLAVLYGLFLYMGVVSMGGNQFFERLSLWATDPALYPSTHFVRRVPRAPLHAFTAVQALCLAVLWVVKASAWGILFPLFIALLVPIRILLPRFFDDAHLELLDAEEGPEEEKDTWS